VKLCEKLPGVQNSHKKWAV